MVETCEEGSIRHAIGVYYVRVFCTNAGAPSLRQVADWIGTRGIELEIVPVRGTIDTHDWSEAEVSGAGRDARFHVELNRVDRSADIARQEIAEFSEMVLVAPESSGKQEVLDHLGRTKFIVANEVPTSTFGAEDYDALGYFCEYFIDHSGGMVQADREGFYRGKKLILPIR